MRVLMLSWEYPPHLQGGLGRHVMELAPALSQQRDLELHLVVPRLNGGAPRETAGNLTVHRVDAPEVPKEQFFSGVWQVNNVMSAYVGQLWKEVDGFDLIHAHDWLVGFVAGAIQYLYDVPLIVTFHATQRGRGRGWLTDDLAKEIHHAEFDLAHRAAQIIACSKFMQAEVHDYFDVPSERVHVIPNGVNTTPFDEQRVKNNQLQRELYALPEETIIFHIGRLVYEKGAQLIIEAAPAILEEFPQVKFVIAGRGPLMDRLQYRAAALHVDSKVLFTGFIPDEEAIKMYSVADVAVFPSLYEPFGMVALEAMAAKVPLVISSVGGLTEVTTHNVTAVTVYPDDVESLRWGIADVLRRPEAASERVERAYQLVRECYSWQHIARMTSDVYQNVLQTITPARFSGITEKTML